MNKKLFILAVVMQCSLLLAMIARQEILLKTGKKITLKCQALDPRSLFSGDYVDLNYEISEIDLKALRGQNDEGTKEREIFSMGNDVFVTLKKNAGDDFFSVSGVSESYSKPKEDAVILCGKIERHLSSGKLRVKYGIENYFVPQNEGKYLEDNMNELHAEVSVKGGKCALSKLFLSGVEVKFY